MRQQRVKKALYASPEKTQDGLLFNGLQNIYDFELGLLKFILALPRHKNFINIGANAGINVVRLHRIFNSVLAVEASSYNLDLLYKNITQNQIQNITVFPVAAYSHQCILKLFGASTGSSVLRGWNNQNDNGVLIQALSLDYILKGGDDFTDSLVLIDVEGAEFDVISGAIKFINESKSSFIVEVTCKEMRPNQEFNPNFLKIFETFWNVGYSSYEVLDDGKYTNMDREMVNQIIVSKRFFGMMVYFSREKIKS
jgi:FkbM family methyltransferase